MLSLQKCYFVMNSHPMLHLDQVNIDEPLPIVWHNMGVVRIVPVETVQAVLDQLNDYDKAPTLEVPDHLGIITWSQTDRQIEMKCLSTRGFAKGLTEQQ